MGRLILSRSKNEEVYIDIGDVRVVVGLAEIRGDKVRLSFAGPPQVEFTRAEIDHRIHPGRKDAE